MSKVRYMWIQIPFNMVKKLRKGIVKSINEHLKGLNSDWDGHLMIEIKHIPKKKVR